MRAQRAERAAQLEELALRIMDEIDESRPRDDEKRGWRSKPAESPSEIAIREFRRLYRERLQEMGVIPRDQDTK